jgi:hypothetical protein
MQDGAAVSPRRSEIGLGRLVSDQEIVLVDGGLERRLIQASKALIFCPQIRFQFLPRAIRWLRDRLARKHLRKVIDDKRNLAMPGLGFVRWRRWLLIEPVAEVFGVDHDPDRSSVLNDRDKPSVGVIRVDGTDFGKNVARRSHSMSSSVTHSLGLIGSSLHPRSSVLTACFDLTSPLAQSCRRRC